ncbi:radical SAM/SPASM domain-containing protein [Mesorhizobium sp. M0025]|uniref:radical SAM/SPASM domain-containing protein n=1 Tax=Mesorhizobium sp. M0025 TaxID=2956846 RepID=UPI0033385686
MKKKIESFSDSIRCIEIEVNSRCNRRCSYCPVSIMPKPPVPKEMPISTFISLLEKLAKSSYRGRISYHFLSEPLLRKDLAVLVRNTKTYLPGSWQVLFSNGDHLDQERYDELRDAGIDQFIITAHDLKKHPERPGQYVQYPDDLEITNRGGALKHLPLPDSATLKQPCFAPSEMLIVTATGDLLLCYEDSSRENVLGNILTSSLDEIWLSPIYVRLRELLSNGRREEAADICRRCTNRAHVVPGRSAASEPFWSTFEHSA